MSCGEDKPYGQPEGGKMADRLDEEAGTNLFNQAWELWFKPEIERRGEAGLLPEPLTLSRMQVIFTDERPPEIRLNDEVHGQMLARIARPFRLGEEVLLDELTDIQGVQLTDQDPNAGHLTFVYCAECWHVAFDSRRNAERSRQHLARARAYLNSAARDLEAGDLAPLCESLWSAVELMVKAELQMFYKDIATGQDHQLRIERFKLWAKLGNTKWQYAELLVHLARLRKQARYLTSTRLPSRRKAQEMLGKAEEMFADLDTRLPRRYV
jgi:HEPN domain-containing protein